MRVLYDDDCGLCARCVSWFADRVPDAEFAPQNQPSRSMVVVVDGVELEEGAALAALFAAAGGTWKVLGALLTVGPFQACASLVYRVVAGHRAKISRMLGWEACRVPPQDGPRLPPRGR